jgi:hypothetical protein
MRGQHRARGDAHQQKGEGLQWIEEFHRRHCITKLASGKEFSPVPAAHPSWPA